MRRLHPAPLALEVLDDQPPMAVVWLVLAAEEAALVDHVPGDRLVDSALLHQAQELGLVDRPGAAVLLVRVEDVGGGCELRDMHVVDLADFPKEEDQVVALAESRKLARVVEAHIDHALRP